MAWLACGGGLRKTGSPCGGKHPLSHTFLPSPPQCCDLLAAPPRQGPRQEQFKHRKKSHPLLIPESGFPRARGHSSRSQGAGAQLSLFSSFLLLPKSFPVAGPPSPRSLGELSSDCAQRWSAPLSAVPSCRSLSRQAPRGWNSPLWAPGF